MADGVAEDDVRAGRPQLHLAAELENRIFRVRTFTEAVLGPVVPQRVQQA